MPKRIAVAVAIASTGFLVFAPLSFYFLVEHNKNFLIGRTEQALGRKISVDQIEMTFWPVGARLVNFALADDPTFSIEKFLRAKELRLELRLLPLFIGQFRPKSAALESPVITVVRDASGRYNLANRAGMEKPRRENADGSKKAPVGKRDGTLFLAPSFKISNGTLRYRDGAGGELVISRINLKISGFEQDQPFEMELEAAVTTAEPNLKLKSRVGPIAQNRDFRDVPLDGEISAADLDLHKVNKALPRLRKALPRALQFDGIYTVQELQFKGTLNRLSLKGTVTGADASFRFE